MKRVVVTDQAFGNTQAELAAAAVKGADVVLNNFAPMTHRVMVGLAPDATIIRYGVGIDNVDMDAARTPECPGLQRS